MESNVCLAHRRLALLACFGSSVRGGAYLTDKISAREVAFGSDGVQLTLRPFFGIGRDVIVVDDLLPELDLLGDRKVFD